MGVPDYQSLMLPVLRSAESGEVRIGTIVEQLANVLNLTDEERTELVPSGRQTVFSNRVHWAKTYLTKAGLLESTKRGHFRITERGRQALAGNPERIDNDYLSRFDQFVAFRQRMNDTNGGHKDRVKIAVDDDVRTPDEVMREAHRTVEAELRQDLLDRILANSPDFFERLVVALLVSMGYGGSVKDAGRQIGKSGDGGVDGVIDQDALGLDRVYVQAKRYAPGNNIGAGQVRDFFGSLDRFKAAKGLFVTTSGFTQDAIDTAEHLSKRIVLIGGDQLAALMLRHNVGVRIEEILYLKKLDEDFFPE